MATPYLQLPAVINLGVHRGECPCACHHCPVGQTERPSRHAVFGNAEIAPQLFRLFCEQLHDCTSTVRIHAVGEPTLHTAFVDLLDTIRSNNLVRRFWLFTSGVFPSSLIRPLVHSIGIIEVSLNSIDAGDYYRTKGIDCFDNVVTTLESMRHEIASNHLDTRLVLTRVSSHTERDTQFEEHWRAKGFESFVRSFHDYSGLLASSRPSHTSSTPEGPKCLVPWRRLNLDGTLVPLKIVAVNCFNELFMNPSQIGTACRLGTFPDLTLKDLWNSERFTCFRQAITDHTDTSTRCDACSYCMTGDGPRAENLLTLC